MGIQTFFVNVLNHCSSSLRKMLRAIGSGDSVLVMPLAKLLTTQEAADVLNMSRPHLIKLLEEGEMPYEKVGRHRRIKAIDVFQYKEKRALTRTKALEEIAELDGKLL